MTQYTDEPMMLGNDATHLFPFAEHMSKLPVSVYRTLPDGSEVLMEYRHTAKVEAVVVGASGDITLRFADGHTVSAPRAEEFSVIDESK